MYEFPLQITSNYVTSERVLSVPWLFRIFQDAAIGDVEKIGYGTDKTLSAGLLWVFSRVYVRIHSQPKYLSHARFETHPGAKKAFLFPRYGTLYDEQGNVAAEISSIWALIREDTRALEMRPPLDSIDQTRGDEIPLPGKVVPKPVTYHGSKTIAYCDVDLNGHLNNVRYIEMLVNLKDASFYKAHRISEMLIQYESEIRYGETVELFADADCTYVRGVVGDRVAFEANLSYEGL